ncbi:MAG: hypothetical protein ABJB22_05020 [Verrucomicrobiota bacterium]
MAANALVRRVWDLKSLAVIASITLVWLGYRELHRPITYQPGVLIQSEPLQTEAAPADGAFDFGKFHLKTLAHFSLDARVLHRRIYRYDHNAALAQVDLAVGWGPMSDQAVLDKLEISQSARFFWYEWRQLPIPQDQIISHATNLHLIPSTPQIASECKSLRTGALIHLSGRLVEATGPEIGTWRSSLSRTDTGNGACELVWVEELRPIEGEERSAAVTTR